MCYGAAGAGDGVWSQGRMPQARRQRRMGSMNIAIYGGSFDMPTLGHLMVVTHLLLNDVSVDRICIPPCFQQRGKTLTEFHHREEMCRLQFGFLPCIEVDPIERDLGGESLTYRLI